MSFTNTWDNSFPPDTQAANQLGADLRNLRLDTQERMAKISGLAADRPNFEGGFAGVIYISTDTNAIERWNGAAWIDIKDAVRGTTGIKVGDLTDLDTIFDNSLVPNGYQKFPRDLIIQWATGVSVGNVETTQVINFPIPFTAACFNVQVSTKIEAETAFSDAIFQIISFNINSVTVQKQIVNNANPVANSTPLIFAIGK